MHSVKGPANHAGVGREVEERPGERIAKVIARAGVASRRDAERLIAQGRVSVNGKLLESPAIRIVAGDEIRIDGKALPRAEMTRLWRYHKPPGLLVSHRDPRGRPTVFQSLPGDMPRVVSVGRLDFTSEGLLLLTNDGELERKLELPATGWIRRYRVRVHGDVTQTALDDLKNGLTIAGTRYGAIDATIERQKARHLWLMIALREGKNREIRRVCEHLGLTVRRLIRVSFGPFQLGNLPRGEVGEVPHRVLREQLGPFISGITEESGAHRRR
jgi:23S rRNA pseudouridine2605 synthase